MVKTLDQLFCYICLSMTCIKTKWKEEKKSVQTTKKSIKQHGKNRTSVFCKPLRLAGFCLFFISHHFLPVRNSLLHFAGFHNQYRKNPSGCQYNGINYYQIKCKLPTWNNTICSVLLRTCDIADFNLSCISCCSSSLILNFTFTR